MGHAPQLKTPMIPLGWSKNRLQASQAQEGRSKNYKAPEDLQSLWRHSTLREVWGVSCLGSSNARAPKTCRSFECLRLRFGFLVGGCRGFKEGLTLDIHQPKDLIFHGGFRTSTTSNTSVPNLMLEVLWVFGVIGMVT